jgi:hypothetical protein
MRSKTLNDNPQRFLTFGSPVKSVRRDRCGLSTDQLSGWDIGSVCQFSGGPVVVYR